MEPEKPKPLEWWACCHQAVRHQCVCKVYFTCPKHPHRGGHHGSHE